MEKKRLAAVVTGEGPNLNEPPWMPPTSVLLDTKRKIWRDAAIHEKWELENLAAANKYKTG